MTKQKENQTVCLIDGSGYIFRAFYALPPMTRSDGTPVNAVYGFMNMLIQLINDCRCSHMVVVFDAARHNFRNNIYPAYKQNRKETPPELIPQFPLIREVCRVLNVPQIEMEGFEADDLIATYTRLARKAGQFVRIISADKDLMQLICDGVSLYDPMKKKTLTEEDVINKFGVLPNKVVDVQSLMGDSIDNVPGANGIGPKTAAQLINEFHSLDGIFEHINDIKSEKRRLGLIQNKEQIYISQKLVQLDDHVPVNTDISDFVLTKPNEKILFDFLSQNNFKSLTNKISSWLTKQSDLFCDNSTIFPSSIDDLKPVALKPIVVKTLYEWKNVYQKILQCKDVTFLLNTLNNESQISSIGIYLNGSPYIIPVSVEKRNTVSDLFSFNESHKTSNIPFEDIYDNLIDILENSNIHKISYDVKKQLHLLYQFKQHICSIQNFDDVLIQNYVLNGSQKSAELSDLAQQYVKTNITEIVEQSDEVRFWPQQLFIIHELYTQFDTSLKNNPFIYQTIELPLISVLFHMEVNGILIDTNQLLQLKIIFSDEINRLSQQIHQIAGEEFNINSPAQIAKILFEKMGLTANKKNTGGSFSTNVQVLEKLAEEGHEIADLILKHRMFGKLKSTYVDALLKQADSANRVHTTFLQTVTNTGRLSSVDPNLQNIPIRTEHGKEIRRAFIARKGYKLICADYSQIELRIMADVANVHQLKESFLKNEDIHARTASQIFKIPLSEIDSDTRRRAKAINFGLIYGISAFGLSNQLGISRSDAQRYIDSYLEHYPEIKSYMAQTEEFVKKNGYVLTPLGRQCFISGLEHPKTRSFAIRAAINAPIQGGAADIIKIAMNQIHQTLSNNHFDAKMLLQVHDELIFEVCQSDVEPVMTLIKDKMEKAIQLSVPLIADVRCGNNWKEAH